MSHLDFDTQTDPTQGIDLRSEIHCYACGHTSTVDELICERAPYRDFYEIQCACGLGATAGTIPQALDKWRSLQIVIFEGCKEPFLDPEF